MLKVKSKVEESQTPQLERPIELQVPNIKATQLAYPPRSSYTFVDLFCGAGGFTEGFLLAGSSSVGFKLVAASDISNMTQLTYEGRFKSQLGLPFEFILRDIRDQSFIPDLLDAVRRQSGQETIDVVCGGPPCQGFAVFGARKETDPRNSLVISYLETIEVLHPRYFIIENVPGLVKMYGGKTVTSIKEAVAAMGPVKYKLSGPLILNAANYGVPQLRERVVLIGCREDMPLIEAINPILSPKEYISAGSAIDDLSFLQPWNTATSYQERFSALSSYQTESRKGRLFTKLGMENVGDYLHNHEAAKHTPEVLARFSIMQKGQGLESIPRELWEKYLNTQKKWCVKLDDAKPSNTVVTLPDDLIHYSQPRILTVREAARLQSFDDTFIFRGPRSTGGGGTGNKKRLVEVPQYSQVGNAVPPLLAKAIAETVLDAVSSENSRRVHALSYNIS